MCVNGWFSKMQSHICPTLTSLLTVFLIILRTWLYNNALYFSYSHKKTRSRSFDELEERNLIYHKMSFGLSCPHNFASSTPLVFIHLFTSLHSTK